MSDCIGKLISIIVPWHRTMQWDSYCVELHHILTVRTSGMKMICWSDVALIKVHRAVVHRCTLEQVPNSQFVSPHSTMDSCWEIITSITAWQIWRANASRLWMAVWPFVFNRYTSFGQILYIHTLMTTWAHIQDPSKFARVKQTALLRAWDHGMISSIPSWNHQILDWLLTPCLWGWFW